MFIAQSVPPVAALMGRLRQRACLQEGPKLDLNKLARKKFIYPGAQIGQRYIRWTYTYTDEPIAQGLLSADMSNDSSGWLRIQIGKLDQKITLQRLPRHFGGGQWYFLCPYRRIRGSVAWIAWSQVIRQSPCLGPPGRL